MSQKSQDSERGRSPNISPLTVIPLSQNQKADPRFPRPVANFEPPLYSPPRGFGTNPRLHNWSYPLTWARRVPPSAKNGLIRPVCVALRNNSLRAPPRLSPMISDTRHS